MAVEKYKLSMLELSILYKTEINVHQITVSLNQHMPAILKKQEFAPGHCVLFLVFFCVELSYVSGNELTWLKNSLLLVFSIQLDQCCLLKHMRVGNERPEKDYIIFYGWQCWFILI